LTCTEYTEGACQFPPIIRCILCLWNLWNFERNEKNENGWPWASVEPARQERKREEKEGRGKR
jgi:hypothetical protein